MKFTHAATAGALTLVAALTLTACSSGTTPGTSTPPTASTAAVDSTLTGTITAGGSSAQSNAQIAWTAAFTAQAKGVTINYDKSQGSGGGVTNWLAGSYDFAGSDSPLSATQQTSAQANCGPDGAMNLPVYLDGVAIIFNLAGVDKLNLTSANVAKIFNRTITSWNDPAIVASNPGVTLPSTAITTVTRSDGSGTTANFTNYLSEVQPSIWTSPASNKWPIAGSSAQQGGSGIVNTVKAGDGTIGYADHSAIGTVKAASIQAGTSSDFVAYSSAGATAAFSASAVVAATTTKGDLAQKLDYTKITSKSAYPIPLISYEIVCKTFKTAAQAKLAKAYIGFVASEVGQKVASTNAGSAPIPTSMLADIQKSLALIK